MLQKLQRQRRQNVQKLSQTQETQKDQIIFSVHTESIGFMFTFDSCN